MMSITNRNLGPRARGPVPADPTRAPWIGGSERAIHYPSDPKHK